MKTHRIVELEDVVNGLNSIVQRNPNSRNARCVYTDTLGNHCLAGQWFKDVLGSVPPAQAGGITYSGVQDWLQEIGVQLLPDAQTLLCDVQRNADDSQNNAPELRRTWEEAVALAFYRHGIQRPEG